MSDDVRVTAEYLADTLPKARRDIRRTDPADFEKLVLETVGAAVHYVKQARKVNQLADTVGMTLAVPYYPAMLPLWEAAAPMLAEEFIALDWTQWHVWIVERATAGDDFEPDPFIHPVKGEYRIRINGVTLATAPKATATPEETRAVAARLLLSAERAEQMQTLALAGGAR